MAYTSEDRERLAGLDLNLLVALRALLREQHVSRAAKRVGVSQPAMSRALAKLRDMFDDPLLIRSLHGMQCTARARAIQPQLENALEGVANLIAPLRFDP
ncbi:MAG: LysR family transcriptional regulator, partial [Myxococcota bacterium]